ncbi:MAG: TlpA disulfide reductase family protein [bacterium]|nr:TlpA disulfide reductase family protein [bacterium]
MKQLLKRTFILMLCLMMLALPAMAEENAKPDVTGILKEYSKLDLSPYLGKVVLVNFFTEWCQYCMQEMPDIRKLTDLYEEDSLQVVLVHPWAGEDASNTENVKERFGMHDMTFFEDEDGLVSQIVGVPGYPTSLFVNPDGTLEAGAAYMLTLEQMTAQLDAMGAVRKAVE